MYSCLSSLVLSADFELKYSIARVQASNHADIALQQRLQQQRTMHRYMMTAGVALTVTAVLYTAAALHTNMQQGVVTKVAEPNSVPQQSWITSMSLNAWRATKNFSKLLADTASMLIAGVVTNTALEAVRSKIQQVYRDETLNWFVQSQTRMDMIFADLKHKTSAYDLYSSLLSAEILNLETHDYMKAFIGDVARVAREHSSGAVQPNENYFAYLLADVQKRYMRQGTLLQQRQEEILPLLAQSRRMMDGGMQAADLFECDLQARADIVKLCNELVHDMQAMIAFIDMHTHNQKTRVVEIVRTANLFLSQIELLVSMSSEQMQELSKQDRGLFTIVYEYERLFKQQIDFLDRYCKVVAL